MNPGRLADLDLHTLVENCAQESSRFRAGHPSAEGHCFELFRRAVDENDQDAWSAIHDQCYYLVATWIGGQPESAELVESTFARFWRTLRDQHLAHRFKHVGAILAYLHKCAVCERIDLERKEQRQVRILEAEKNVWRDHSVEAQIGAMFDHDELCSSVRRWLNANICDCEEQQIIFFSYDLGLSPAEIMRRYPEEFASVEQVRKIKERLLKRLRRSGELEQLLTR